MRSTRSSSGTHAHAWVESFPTELDAFRAYADFYPDSTTLLLDTVEQAGYHARLPEPARPEPAPGAAGNATDDSAAPDRVESLRQRVVVDHPGWVGNRDGIPFDVRDTANRASLATKPPPVE